MKPSKRTTITFPDGGDLVVRDGSALPFEVAEVNIEREFYPRGLVHSFEYYGTVELLEPLDRERFFHENRCPKPFDVALVDGQTVVEIDYALVTNGPENATQEFVAKSGRWRSYE